MNVEDWLLILFTLGVKWKNENQKTVHFYFIDSVFFKWSQWVFLNYFFNHKEHCIGWIFWNQVILLMWVSQQSSFAAVPECAALLCPENSRCSPSSQDETKLECKCLPNYRGDGHYCERELNLDPASSLIEMFKLLNREKKKKTRSQPL